MAEHLDRRRFLGGVGALAASAAVAGCRARGPSGPIVMRLSHSLARPRLFLGYKG